MPVDTVTITSVVCVVLLLVSLFFLLFAASSFAYPQSSTTVEVYPADVSPPRQWRTILIMMGIAALSAGLAVAVCMLILLPSWRTSDAETITRKLLREKHERTPEKIEFEDNDSRNMWEQLWVRGWRKNGTVWLGNNEVWHVTVEQFREEQFPHELLLVCRVVKGP